MRQLSASPSEGVMAVLREDQDERVKREGEIKRRGDEREDKGDI